MPRRWAALALLLVLMATTPAVARADAETARVVVDGIELKSDVAPQLIGGRTMVPFRAIAEALGVAVTWDGERQMILAEGHGQSLRLIVGQRSAWINGAERTLDVAPQLVAGRTLVPARLFAEAFGAAVTWDEASRTASVRSGIRPMRTLAFYGLGSYPWREYIPRFAHVAFAWAGVNPLGELDLADETYFWPQGAEEVLDLARNAGVERYLTVIAWDDDGRLTRLIADPAARERLADQVAEAVISNGLEGVVLDLEGLGWSEQGEALRQVQQGFTALVAAVSARLHPAGREVIVAVQPPNGWYKGYDYKGIAGAADLLLMMAYPYWPAEVEKPEPLDLVAEAVALSLQEVPAEKLLLGILVEHETGETVTQKVGLAKRNGLAGIAVWILRSLDEVEMEAIEGLVTPLR